MTIIQNTFDGGTDGAAVSTGNSGGASGDAFTAVEATLVFSNTQAHSAPLSIKIPATASGYGRWAVAGSDRTFQGAMYVYAEVATTEDYIILRTQGDTAASTAHIMVLLNPDNKLRLRTSAASANIWTATDSFPLNRWIRVELLEDIGTTSSDGSVRVAYFEADSTTPIEDSGWLTGQNLRGDTTVVGQIYAGKAGTTTASLSTYMDDMKFLTGSDYTGEFIGPETVPFTSPIYRIVGGTPVPVHVWRIVSGEPVELDATLI